MYSQNQEEDLIIKFFKKRNEYASRLLSIGENDGETISNARALIELGWRGVLVEPDPVAFAKLEQLYNDTFTVELYNIAIGERDDEEADFFQCGTHFNKGDTGLLSTLKEDQLTRFPGVTYEKIKVRSQTLGTFYGNLKHHIFPFVSIDAEGMDLFILRKMDFNAMGTALVCVEWNSKDRHLYDQTMYRFNFKLINVNGENLIYAR